jgi:hypothetical protein
MSETLVIDTIVAEGVFSVETQMLSVVSPEQVVVALTERPDTVAVEFDASAVSLLEDSQIYIIADGAQGPVGPPGPTGGYALQYPAGEALGGHRMVVLDDTGKAIYADSTILTHANKVLGITTGAASVGATATIQTGGEMTEPSWSWVLGTPIWLSLAGMLTQVAPVTGFSLIVAFPVSATKAIISLREPIFLN